MRRGQIMRGELTVAREQALFAFGRFVVERGIAPTYRDLSTMLGGISTNAVADRIAGLLAGGYIERRRAGISRGMVLTTKGRELVARSGVEVEATPDEDDRSVTIACLLDGLGVPRGMPIHDRIVHALEALALIVDNAMGVIVRILAADDEADDVARLESYRAIAADVRKVKAKHDAEDAALAQLGTMGQL